MAGLGLKDGGFISVRPWISTVRRNGDMRTFSTRTSVFAARVNAPATTSVA